MPYSLLMDPHLDLVSASPLASSATTSPDRARDLLRRWAAGDEEAFACLVRDHQDGAYRYARRMCGDHELARDLVQEAFVRVVRHHDRLNANQSFAAWLLHIVRNLTIDALRRRRTRSQVPYEDHLRDTAASPVGNALEASELRRRIAHVLSELPEKYREILVMREMDGMAAEDIAVIIGVDYGTTRWRLHKARNLFRSAWLARFGDAP